MSFEVLGVRMKTHLLKRDFIFLNLLQLQILCVFKMQYSKPHHQFSTLSDFICYFHAFTDFFELWDTEIQKHFKWTLKMLKLGMVSSFHPNSMCKKVGRLTTKTRRTSCTKRTISFEVWGFHTETRLIQRDFIFLTCLNSIVFLCSKCTIQRHMINFQPFLTSFVIFHAFTDYFSWMALKLKSTTNEL